MIFVVQIPFSGSKGYILLPGSEIPEWFSFKSEGSSMTLEMTPDFFNKNRVLSFAFSAIVGCRFYRGRSRKSSLIPFTQK